MCSRLWGCRKQFQNRADEHGRTWPDSVGGVAYGEDAIGLP